jgi:hypothetical protein
MHVHLERADFVVRVFADGDAYGHDAPEWTAAGCYADYRPGLGPPQTAKVMIVNRRRESVASRLWRWLTGRLRLRFPKDLLLAKCRARGIEHVEFERLRRGKLRKKRLEVRRGVV